MSIFERIVHSSDIHLTLAHSGPKRQFGGTLDEIQLQFEQLGPFAYYKGNLQSILNQYDVVVCMLYVMNLSLLKLPFLPSRKFKLIYWGIGVRASYNNPFDAPTPINQVRYLIAKKADAMIFYSDYARNKYISKGISAEKLFVMQNTVEVNKESEVSPKRDKLLFVGSLYKSKKIFQLLESYQKAKSQLNSIPKLHIVGNGSEYASVLDWIDKTSNQDNIILHGSVFEEDILAGLFQTSLACISPGQAGLTVLKSFGYGVPFVTQKDAITGGERLNIVHNENGVLYNSEDDLVEIIKDISTDPEKYINMGIQARDFYFKERTPEIMAQGFIDAVNYVTHKG
jgi:glycosyltransferase involved in cell wall biosynthesis